MDSPSRILEEAATRDEEDSSTVALSALREHLWSISPSDFSKTFEVNTVGTFYTLVAFLSLLDAGNKRGNVSQQSQVIAMSSISGFNRRVPGGFAYGGSKAAVTQMMKQAATVLGPLGIRSNIIAPGIYPSEMTSASRREEDPRTSIAKTEIPMQKHDDEVDMAGVILFLASRAGAYCNGCVLVTDGGRLSVMPSSY